MLRPALAVFLVLQLVLIQLMAVSPALHEELHDHDCHGHSPKEPPCVVELWQASGGQEIPPPVMVPEAEEVLPMVAMVLAPCRSLLLPAGHFRGGRGAHSPPRAP